MVMPWSTRAWLLLLLLYNVLVGSPCTARRQASNKVVLRISMFENCATPDMAIQLVDKTLTWVKGEGHVVNATLTVSRVVQSLRMMFVEIDRCRDAMHPNTCEYYATWPWKTGICNLVVMPSMAWTPLIHSVHPPIVCPIKTGTYHAVNAAWDMNHPVIKQVMGEHIPWKGTVYMLDQNNATVLCLRGIIQGATRE